MRVTPKNYPDVMVALGGIIIIAWAAILVLAVVRGETLLAGLAGIIVGLEAALAATGAQRRRVVEDATRVAEQVTMVVKSRSDQS